MYFYLIFCLYSDVLSFVSSVRDMHQSMFFPSSTGSSEDEASESVVTSLWFPLLALTSRQANRGPQEHKGPSTDTHWVSGRAAAARPSWPRGSKLSRLPGRSCSLVTVMSRPEFHLCSRMVEAFWGRHGNKPTLLHSYFGKTCHHPTQLRTPHARPAQPSPRCGQSSDELVRACENIFHSIVCSTKEGK